jgi:membrane-associated phospholipid phosphatase
MDPFRPVDWGAYYLFDFVAQKHPGLVSLAQIYDALSGYVACTLLMAVLAWLLWRRGQTKAALVNLAVFAVAVAVVEIVRWAVGRTRPDEAERMVGPEGMLGSYPARHVFLFTMAMLLVAFAEGARLSARRRLAFGIFVALMIVCVCGSQLLLRLHFVTDVVAGLFGGAGCALAAHLLGRGS